LESIQSTSIELSSSSLWKTSDSILAIQSSWSSKASLAVGSLALIKRSKPKLASAPRGWEPSRALSTSDFILAALSPVLRRTGANQQGARSTRDRRGPKGHSVGLGARTKMPSPPVASPVGARPQMSNLALRSRCRMLYLRHFDPASAHVRARDACRSSSEPNLDPPHPLTSSGAFRSMQQNRLHAALLRIAL